MQYVPDGKERPPWARAVSSLVSPSQAKQNDEDARSVCRRCALLLRLELQSSYINTEAYTVLLCLMEILTFGHQLLNHGTVAVKPCGFFFRV